MSGGSERSEHVLRCLLCALPPNLCFKMSAHIGLEIAPKWCPDVPNMGPKWSQDCSHKEDTLVQHGSNMVPQIGPGAILGASWGHLGAGSWRPLGPLLAASWTPPRPNQTALERLLGAPRGIPRQFSPILGAQIVLQGSPGGCQIEIGRGPSRKHDLIKSHCLFQWNFMVFDVPGSFFGP